ncbi:hypothetical protein ZEAMMB73_Zm00001d004210 [Zea mays]|uniref:Uncharacterized protein n=1 Tax=Zea mays TaxID=4577 RepID=A0A1D6EEH0_MAIZE|nr:hypothetical protein ZEAMMB73_Zm00001d004210 [Zea mays]
MQVEGKIDEDVPSVNVGESDEVTKNTSQETKAEVDLIDDVITESNFTSKNIVEVNSAAHEVNEIEHEKVEVPGGCQSHEIENSSALEPKKEFEMEVDGVVPLQGATTSMAYVVHHEPRSIDFLENDSGNHSSPTTALESCDHVRIKESISHEVTMATVDQPISVDQVELVNLNEDELVVDDDQPDFDPRCESDRLDKPRCISKKDDSNEIVEDSKSLENQLEICNAINY